MWNPLSLLLGSGNQQLVSLGWKFAKLDPRTILFMRRAKITSSEHFLGHFVHSAWILKVWMSNMALKMSRKLALLIIVQILLVFGPKNELFCNLVAPMGVSTPNGMWEIVFMVIGTKFEQLSNPLFMTSKMLKICSLWDHVAMITSKMHLIYYINSYWV